MANTECSNQTNPIQQTIIPLIRLPTLKQATGISRSKIYRDIKAGLLPRPVQIGGDRVAWPANEIDAINRARIAGKSEEEIKQIVIELEMARSAV